MPRRASFGHELVFKDTPLSEQTVGLDEGARLVKPIPHSVFRAQISRVPSYDRSASWGWKSVRRPLALWCAFGHRQMRPFGLAVRLAETDRCHKAVICMNPKHQFLTV